MKHEQFIQQYCHWSYPVQTEIKDEELAFVLKLRRNAKHPHELAEAIEQVEALVRQYQGHEQLLFSLLELMERKGDYPEMHKHWEEMTLRFPENEACLRMHLRWLRRRDLVSEGRALIEQRYPDRHRLEAQAISYIDGLREMKLGSETSEFIEDLPLELRELPAIKAAYIRNLLHREQYRQAAAIAATLENDQDIGAADRESVAKARAFGVIRDRLAASGAPNPSTCLVNLFTRRSLRAVSADRPGRIALFTSQLGAGGAERQFAKMAIALNETHVNRLTIDGRMVSDPVQVAVKHCDPLTDKDFFLPFLRNAGIDVTILTQIPEPEVKNPFEHMGDAGEVFHLLSKNHRKAVNRLASIYKKSATETAYIWQDDGMHIAGLAALAAGVPRIVLCFRSTPLKIRRDFVRPGFEGYLEALVNVPGVTVACNSHIMAAKYADWLGIPPSSVVVVPNAATSLPVEGEQDDLTIWNAIRQASPECDKTVLGVFRLHPVKRPEVWVNLAEKYIQNDRSARFVIVGSGVEETRISDIIKARGLQNRVFLAGRRKAVGFWLDQADVVLHCSRYEGLPNAILEAQLAGRPVIAAPAGGTEEAFVQGKSGVCLSRVEPFPYDEALLALKRLLSDVDLRRELGDAGRAFVANNFSMEKSLQETVRLLCAPVNSRQS